MADSAPSMPKRFWPRYLVARNFSSASAALSRSRMWRCSSAVSVDGDALDLLLDPALLGGLLDVHVLDADGAAVGVAQHVEDVAERHPCAPGDAAGEELAVEVPDGQPVGGRVELGVHVGLLGRQRVEVGDEVAADPVHVDERAATCICFSSIGCSRSTRVDVAAPLDGLVGHAERPEDVLVEVVVAHQQLVDPLEEQARLGALDDAVVVGRGDGHDLRQAEVGERGGVGALRRRWGSRASRRRR